MQDGTEIRLDKFVVINDVLSFSWYIGSFFAVVIVAALKTLLDGRKGVLCGVVNILFVLSFVLFAGCSLVTFQNSIMWLSDVPVSVVGDNAYTSNPTLSKSLPYRYNGFVGVLPNKIASYKKRARMAYIKKADSPEKIESLWEMLFNDKSTYEYEAKNDFWLYLREYYLFLESIEDEDVAGRGFDNAKTHVKDFGAYVDEGDKCIYVSSTLLMLKFEEDAWKAKLWSELVAKYMSVALIETDLYDGTRTCWLGSLPRYLLDDQFEIGGEEHLRILADALWEEYNSFEVQTSQTHAVFHSDAPREIVDFYTALSEAKDQDSFYGYTKSIEGVGYDWGG